MVKYITHKFREVSPFNLRNNYHIRKRQINCKINVREYRMDNPEKLATYDRQDAEKQSKNTTQYVLDKQTNKHK